VPANRSGIECQQSHREKYIPAEGVNTVPCCPYLWGFTVNATELFHNSFITDYNAGVTIVTVH
jgi:hypothetical protein